MGKEPEKNIFEINLNRLEQEAAELPALIKEWGKEYARAKRDAARAKNILKLAMAEKSKEVRDDPAAFGIDGRVTEGSIECVVLQDQEIRHCQDNLILADYDEDSLKITVDALKEKGEQIGNLTKLHGQMYWNPHTASPARDAKNERIMQEGDEIVERKRKKRARD